MRVCISHRQLWSRWLKKGGLSLQLTSFSPHRAAERPAVGNECHAVFMERVMTCEEGGRDCSAACLTYQIYVVVLQT